MSSCIEYEEEERLVQMVHDFIESESVSESSPVGTITSSSCSSFNSHPSCLMLQEILGSRTEAEGKVLESVLKHMRSKREREKCSGLNKWLITKLKMDGFNASLYKTSCLTSSGCPAGYYEYIDIMVEDDEKHEPMRLIVDTDFKSQFEVARPTQAYKELTNTLPSIFVGNEEKLNKIISLLCSAAKQSLKERGLHIPPWRTSAYMQSKWLSGCHKLQPKTGFISKESLETIRGRSHGTLISKLAPASTATANPVGVVKPKPKPKKRDFRPGSGLSSQFSNMGINCC